MHVDNARILIERLESVPDDEFNMTHWFSKKSDPFEQRTEMMYGLGPIGRVARWATQHTCGTAACVAGHINLIRNARWNGWQREAAWLGLNDAQAHKLFRPTNFKNPYAYSRAQAIRTLKHMVDTFEATGTAVVDWSVKESVAPAPASTKFMDPALPDSIRKFVEPV